MGTGAHRVTGFPKAFPEVEQQAIARRTRLFPGAACELQRTSGRQYSVSGVQVSFRGLSEGWLARASVRQQERWFAKLSSVRVHSLSLVSSL